MHAILSKTLDCIAEESPRFHDSFQHVDTLISVYGESLNAERLYDDIDESIPWKLIAELFGILTWSLSDNGAAIMQTMERWLLEGSDLRKIRIAINLEAYPFSDTTRMQEVFATLGTRYPELRPELSSVINNRRQSEMVGFNTHFQRLILAGLLVLILGVIANFYLRYANDHSGLITAKEWARLNDLPSTATNISVEQTGSLFTREITVTFLAPLDDIRFWLEQSPGTQKVTPTMEGSVRTYKIAPGGGAQHAQVEIDEQTHVVKISVYWS